MSPDRAAWVESLFERFDGEWFSSDVGDLRHNPTMPALLMKLAKIAAEKAEVLVEQSQCARCMEGGPEWSEALEAEG